MLNYIVMIQRFDTPEECLGDYYLDILNDVFSTENEASKAMFKALVAECENLEADTGENIHYHIEENSVCSDDEVIANYWVQQVYIPEYKIPQKPTFPLISTTRYDNYIQAHTKCGKCHSYIGCNSKFCSQCGVRLFNPSR